jgi:hypothetical protein
MKLSTFFLFLVGAFAPCIVDAQTNDKECNCKEYPFEPNPPCNTACRVKHLAIAPEYDLHTIFGLREPLAAAIAVIRPNNRPHYLEGYKQLMADNDFEGLKHALYSLKGDSFAQVRADAEKYYKIDIDDLTGEWTEERKEALRSGHKFLLVEKPQRQNRQSHQSSGSIPSIRVSPTEAQL